MKLKINKRHHIIYLAIFIITIFSCSDKKNNCFVKNTEIISEIEHIKKLLLETSPYIDMKNSGILDSLDVLSSKALSDKNNKIKKEEYSDNLRQILSNLGDRHFHLNYIGNCKENSKYYLPFGLAPWKNNQAVAVVKAGKGKFSLFMEDFPYLSRIDNYSLIDFIHKYDPENKKAPEYSCLSLGVDKLNELYKIKKGLRIGDKLKLTFLSKDLKKDSVIFIKVGASKNKWRDIDSYIGDNKEEPIIRLNDNNILYLKIPKMYSYSENPKYFQLLKEKLKLLKDSNALIIDVRNNSGGSRDLIDFFSDYFLKPDEYKVVNIAKNKGSLNAEIIKNLETKYLYPYSKFKNAKSKEAINNFLKTFHPDVQLNNKLYSEYFYMVLNNKNIRQKDTFYFEKPVYILANEMTFSSASIFVSVFKGIGNIKIAGIPTDGSSGMPTTYNLNQSQIQFTISQMISFQKNGNLFDGIGTDPDIQLPRTISQILCNEDDQVQQLIKIAKKMTN